MVFLAVVVVLLMFCPPDIGAQAKHHIHHTASGIFGGSGVYRGGMVAYRCLNRMAKSGTEGFWAFSNRSRAVIGTKVMILGIILCQVL